MKALKKILSVQVTLAGWLVILVGLLPALEATVRAQGSGAAAWVDTDIGLAPTAGNAQTDGAGNYVLTSSGSDIWGTSDAGNYLYETLGTNGELVAEVVGVQGNSDYLKAGVMIRESLDAGARNAMMLVTADHGTYFQWRPGAGGESWQTSGSTNVLAPCWVKIVRSGDWVGGYSSTDGTNWTLVGWKTFYGLSPQVYVGMAVTSHDPQGSPATAVFDQVSLSFADSSEVINPVVGSGDGLRGRYYANRDLFGGVVTNRVDGQINFNWQPLSLLQHQMGIGVTNRGAFESACQAALGMGRCDQFSVRWTGELQAQFTEPYTIYARSDDGIRVWLNEQLIIDDWQCGPCRERQATVNLTAGQRYLLRVEYFQNHREARVKLSWSSPSTPKRVIPQSQLYSRLTMDGNGLPVYWEEHYFGRTGVAAGADACGDGLANLQEYRHWFNPTSVLNWGLPKQWTHGDIEYNGGSSHGEAGYSNGVFTVSSSGRNIWDHHDDFQYVFQAIGTNGEIVARLVSDVNHTNTRAKAGLMLRESLQDDARDVMLALNWTNAVESSEWRQATDDKMQKTRGWRGQSCPCWMKVVRSGDWVGEYVSDDGTNWTLFDWQTLSRLSRQVFVGLAVTAPHLPGKKTRATAQFDEVSVGPAPAADIMDMVTGTGNGLEGHYRNDSLLYLPPQASRLDHGVNFHWGHGVPMPWINPDSYGVSWSGEVQAQFSEPYTFSMVTRREDWVRVWVNEHLVIDQWRNWHQNGDFKGTPVNLVAGRHYLIRVEMFNNLGHGRAVLKWSSPSTPERVIPWDQLYSPPQMDPDGSGLPVIWERIYFGQTGVDPNADPDQDGLSNLQEYRLHTNPLKSDTDGDGMPDAWEIAHGLDPQFDDAGLDYDNSGFNNLQKYEYGLDPFNPDVNGDGLPDSFEEQYLGTGTTFACTNQISEALVVNGAQATNYLGRWQVDGTDIYCLGRRGGVDFNLPLRQADKYVLNLTGTQQNQFNPLATSFKLLLSIDDQNLGHYTLRAGYGTNGTVEVVLPYLQAGRHVLHVFWDGVASYSHLRIKQVKLLGISGSTNQAGIKTWAAKMIGDESSLDDTNAEIGSYISPVCLEGRDPCPQMMQLTNGQTNALSPVATSDKRWYVNVPLQAATPTVFQASFQNGALTQSQNLKWLPVNLLNPTNLTIRLGDSLLFDALPANVTNGILQVTIGSNNYSSDATRPIPYRFTQPGTYTVSGTYTSTSGSSQTGNITVNVVQQDLPEVPPSAWTGMERSLILTNLAPGVVLQADSRLTCFISKTNANGGVRLALGTEENEPRSIIARLGAKGPILGSVPVEGFDVWSGDQAYTKVLQVYPDGSQLVEMMVISSPVQPDVDFVIQTIVGGVTFEDGTTQKILTAKDFDALGQCPVRFIRPASARTSVCNSIKAFQAPYQIGYLY